MVCRWIWKNKVAENMEVCADWHLFHSFDLIQCFFVQQYKNNNNINEKCYTDNKRER